MISESEVKLADVSSLTSRLALGIPHLGFLRLKLQAGSRTSPDISLGSGVLLLSKQVL